MKDNARARGTFLAMLALKDGARHGYDIAAYIKERSGGFFSLSFGSLYPILHALEQEGLAKGTWQEVGESKSRKVYSLTVKGRRALEEETRQCRSMIEAFVHLLEVKA